MMKRRRSKLCFGDIPGRHRRTVRFATPLVQEMQIPAVVDEAEKERLFYSNLDFARFAFNERVRRDASAGKPIKFNPVLSIAGIPAGLIVSRVRPYYEYQRFLHRKIIGGELRTWAEYQQLLK